MASCKNCFLFDEYKLYSKVGFFERRQDMLIFILNVILNIRKYYFEYCKCDGENVCLPCQTAEIFNEETVNKIYKNCLDLDMLCKVKENLHLNLNNLLEKHDHFLCKVINERYHYYHKCIFTGKHVFLDIGVAVPEWENLKVNEIVNNKPQVNLENYFMKENIFKIFNR